MYHFSRRHFIKLFSCLAGVAVVTSCSNREERPRSQKAVIGRIANLKEGINLFRLERVIVSKEGNNLSAMSMVCTHQYCAVSPKFGSTGFFCPCHGSEFGSNGLVQRGPAVKPLPFYELNVNEKQELVVNFEKEVAAEWRLMI